MLALLAVAPAAVARTKKGDKLIEDGRQAEARKDYDKALDLFEQALALDPMDGLYQLCARRARFQAGQMHVDNGQKLRSEGKLDEALKEFQKAFAIDPASGMAEQEMRKTYQMIEREEVKKKRGEKSSPEDAGLTPVQQARKETEQRIQRLLDVPELRPSSTAPVNLKMSSQPPKVLFETLGKLTGINVIFDQEYLDQTISRKYSIDLANTTLDEALDHLALLAKAFWKPLSPNAIFVTADNITKRRDYEEHVTKVFYIQNVTSPQDLTEIMTAMRTVVDIRKVMPYNGQNAIVVRGTADAIALAEKVLMDLDKPRPEVLVDVLILEVTKARTRELAASILTSGAQGINLPISYAPGGTAKTSLNLEAFKDLNWRDYATSVPTAILQATLSDTATKVINQPQLRVMDGQKAQLNLGQRYPIATGSFQPGVGTVGVSPLVSTQFQYQDIGVNVGLTPRIHSNDEVSMEIEAEVSGLQGIVDVGGLKQPIIGSRKVKHVIRVREGEVSLIGGLMSSSETRTRAGVPWLMDVPVIGRLFSNDHVERNANDVIIALLPHIVRAPDITAENLRPVASGSEQIYKMTFAPRTAPAGAAAVAPTQPVTAGPPAAATAKPAAAQATPEQMRQALGAALVPGTPGGQATPPPPPDAIAPAASGGPQLVFRQAATEVQVGGTLSVDVVVSNVDNLFSSPMKLKFDAKVLKLVEITKGGFLGGDGQQVTFSETKLDDPGGAIITMNRVPGAGGISGSGALVTLKFQAVGKGATELAFDEVVLRDARLQTIQVTPPAVKLTVK